MRGKGRRGTPKHFVKLGVAAPLSGDPISFRISDHVALDPAIRTWY